MTNEKAIKLLREMQEAWKLQITGDAFDALEMAITALQQLDKNLTKPNNSNQEVAKDTNVLNNDTISRQAAINVTWEEPTYTDPLNVLTEVRDRIKALPSVQPETCEGCKHLNKWENEVEYGYPSPCTRCKRRVGDRYER